MATVNMLEAKTKLSKLVQAVESGAEAEVIIARNGKPVAKLVPLDAPKKMPLRIGMYDGIYPITTQEEFDADNEEIAALFYGEDK